MAQLHADDIADLPRPGGADLLQVLWCPIEHSEGRYWGPAVSLYWRRRVDITDVLADPPVSHIGNDHYVPQPCRLHPEQVVEYPWPEELPDDLAERLDDDYTDTFIAPGWKVGGYAAWNLTDLLPTPCPSCAGPTDLLLNIDSTEYDGGTRDRWQPIEERDVGWDHPDRFALQSPTGIKVGRCGALRVFICPRCPGTPYRLDLQ